MVKLQMFFQIQFTKLFENRGRTLGRVRRVVDGNDVGFSNRRNCQILRQAIDGLLDAHWLARRRCRQPGSFGFRQAAFVHDLGQEILACQQLDLRIDLVLADFIVSDGSCGSLFGCDRNIDPLILHQNFHARFVLVGKHERENRRPQDHHDES